MKTYLYFEDWSAFLTDLEKRNIPHDGRIIKVFVSAHDPREYLDNPRLKVIPASAAPLHNVVLRYRDDRVFPGEEIEQFMEDIDLNVPARRIVRTLVNFADMMQIWQGDMGIRIGCRRLINHPLDKIDGLLKAAYDPGGRTHSIHMDIFTAPSLQQLRSVLDYDDIQLLAPAQEGVRFKKEICSLIEGNA
jgi:hypothetical protein